MDAKKEMVVYVKLEDYKDITDIVNLIKSKLKEAKYVLAKIAELKRQEDAELQKWSSELDNVEEKVSLIDRTLAEPEV